MIQRNGVFVMALCPLLLSACASAPSPIGRLDAAASSGQVASADDIDRMCDIAQCSRDLRITLKREDGSMFDRTYDALPVVQEAGVSVYAGQTVHIEAEVEDGNLVNLRLVDVVRRPERTLTATLEQDEEGNMMLSTSNPFDRHLRIRMGMMPLSHDELVSTSSCPVIAGGGSFELWPYPIFQVFLGRMRLIEASESMDCVE